MDRGAEATTESRPTLARGLHGTILARGIVWWGVGPQIEHKSDLLGLLVIGEVRILN